MRLVTDYSVTLDNPQVTVGGRLGQARHSACQFYLSKSPKSFLGLSKDVCIFVT